MAPGRAGGLFELPFTIPARGVYYSMRIIMPLALPTSLGRRGAPRVFSALVWLTAALPVATHSRSAAAQSQDDLDRARNLFREGLSLEAAGNWAQALAKFHEVGKVKLTPQVRFHTARCNEQLGHLNTALGEYKLAEYEGSQQNIPELASITQARQALEARVPKLVIRRGPGAELAQVELDGVDLGENQIGQPVGVDPGPHRIVAKLPGDREFQYAAFVKEAETKEVELAPPPGEEPAAAPGKPKAPGADQGVSTEAPPKRSVLPWVIGGVGVAGLVGSGVFYILRNGAKSDLESTCHGNVCPTSSQDTENKGKLYTMLSMVSLGVGVVGIGVATVLLVTAPKKEEPAHAGLNWDVVAGPGDARLMVNGRF